MFLGLCDADPIPRQDSKPGQWWPAASAELRNDNVTSEYGWAVIATGLRGDETVAELQALAGVSS